VLGEEVARVLLTGDLAQLELFSSKSLLKPKTVTLNVSKLAQSLA
jgi:hypothetical protein